MAVTSVRNSQAAGAGKKRLLPRNARGTEKTAPTQVPTSAMATVSSRR
ncbi:Uncharacterised protein [uncultured Blautia sp.]|nr:Uncharacterised protein [uncultured Blautia sp.]